VCGRQQIGTERQLYDAACELKLLVSTSYPFVNWKLPLTCDLQETASCPICSVCSCATLSRQLDTEPIQLMDRSDAAQRHER